MRRKVKRLVENDPFTIEMCLERYSGHDGKLGLGKPPGKRAERPEANLDKPSAEKIGAPVGTKAMSDAVSFMSSGVALTKLSEWRGLPPPAGNQAARLSKNRIAYCVARARSKRIGMKTENNPPKKYVSRISRNSRKAGKLGCK